MIRSDGLRCTWDFRDRLVAVEDDTMRAEYRYDVTGRRIIKRVTPKAAPAAPASPSGDAPKPARPTATLYPGQHFEVREHDQPTKYVFRGATRVARVTSSFSLNTRVQRFRLHSGWNLLSLAVTAPNALRQLTDFQSSILNPQSVVRWNQPTLTWLPLAQNETLPAGAILWLHAASASTLVLTGSYLEPVNRPIPAGGSFLPSAGLEVLPLFAEGSPDQPAPLEILNLPVAASRQSAAPFLEKQSATFSRTAAIGVSVLRSLTGLNAASALWHFESSSQTWKARLPSIRSFDPGFLEFLAPGSAIFIQSDSPAELAAPEPTLRISYYHRDHLGSSSVMSDAAGALLEETAFYPFGEARHEHQLRQVDEFYGFTQKERDRESELHYFEARFLSGPRSRFLSVDPKFASLEAATSDPQQLNLYAYARNNPVLYIDPTGLDFGVPEPAGSFDEIDVDTTAEAIGGFLNSTWLGSAIKAPPKINDAASFSGGFGDAILNPMAKFAGVRDFGLGFGQMTRLALGINNVDTSSPDYAGGAMVSTLLQFAATGGVSSVAKTAVVESAIESRVANTLALRPTQPAGANYSLAWRPTQPAGGTMVTGSGDVAQAVARQAQAVKTGMYADPHWGPILRAADATRAARMTVEATSRNEAVEMLGALFKAIQ